MRSIPKRARSKSLAAVAMNSMAQHAVPKGIGHNELARPQLTRKSSRVTTQPSCASGAYWTVRCSAGVLNPIAVPPSVRVLVPLQRAFLPDVNEADQQNQHEHQHLTQAEKGDVPNGARVVHQRDETGQLPVVNRPRDHEHRLDIEDYEQDRDEVESNREALACVAKRRDSRFVRLLLDRRRPRADRQSGDPDDRQRVDHHETEEHQNREISASHGVSDFVKNFTSAIFWNLPSAIL